MQHGLERDGGRGRQLVAQRQRPLCGQLGDETVRERLQVFVVFVVRPSDLAANGDDGALNNGRVGIGAVRSGHRGIGLAVRLRLACGRLVLRPDVATVDRQRTFGIDADEDASAGDGDRIISDGPIVEGGERRLDLAEPFVHFVRQLVGAVILLFQFGVFGLQRVDRRLLLAGEVGGGALQFAQAQRAIISIRRGRMRSGDRTIRASST